MITDMEKEIRKIVREEILIREKEREPADREERRGADWTVEEIRNLVGELKASISMMARFHKRTHIGIAYKIDKLYRNGSLEYLKRDIAWKEDR